MRRQVSPINLGDWPDQHEVPARAARRNAVEQLAIEPFVEHAEESDPRAWNRLWSAGSAIGPSRAREVVDVDAARALVDVGVQSALGFVEAPPAGEHEVAFDSSARSLSRSPGGAPAKPVSSSMQS